MLVFLERDSVTSASNINIISSLYLKGEVECVVVALHVGDCLKIPPKGAFYSFSPLDVAFGTACEYLMPLHAAPIYSAAASRPLRCLFSQR